MQQVYIFTYFMYCLLNCFVYSFHHVHYNNCMAVNNELDTMRRSGPDMSCRNLPGGAEGQYSVPEPRFERENARIQVSNITTLKSYSSMETYLE